MILGGVYRRILSVTWRKLSHYSQNSTSSVKYCALRDVRRTCLFTIPVSVTHLCTQTNPSDELLIPLKSETKEKRNAKPKKKKKITKKIGDSGLTQDQSTTQTAAQCPDNRVLTTSEAETVSQEANSRNKLRRKKTSKKNVEEKILGMQSHEENSTRKKRKRTVKQNEEETFSVYFPFEGDGSTTPDDRTVLRTDDKQQSSAKTGEHLFTIKKLDKPGGRFYRISSDEGVCEFPSVTNVLTTTRTTQNFFMLRNWIQNMIKQHGMSGYERIRKETIRKGKDFHQLLENKLQLQSLQLSAQASTTSTLHPTTVPPATSVGPTSNSPIETTPPLVTTSSLEEQQTDTQTSQSQENSEEDSGYLQSVHHVLQDISDIHALEGVTVHKELGYTGTFDCVAKYKDELCVIDWKTSVRPKPSLEDCYDFPLQATAYAGAINQDPHYPFKVFNALIVVAYPSGEPAHAHFISHEQSMHYWARWLARLKEYHTMFAHDLSEVHI